MRKYNVIIILIAIALGAVLGACIFDIVDYFRENAIKGKDLTISIIFGAAVIILVSLLFLSYYLLTKERRRKAFRLAYHDSELDAPNETFFKDILTQRIRKGTKGYVAVLDIIRFKDTAAIGLEGEDYGRIIDSLIAKVMNDFHPMKKQKENFAHRYIGGFLLFRESANLDAYLKEIVELRNRINEQIEYANLNYASRLVIGVRAYEEGMDMMQMIDDAEMARLSDYPPKEENVIIYEASMKSELIEEIKLSKELEEAIKNEQLDVYYQPKFDIKNSKFIGAEALVRWHHPEKGLVMPATFIPLAEKTNQVVSIDRFVFKKVCQDLASWRKAGKRLLTISVNLSRNGLYQSDLIDFFKKNLKETKVSPLLIEIELTESSASKDMLFVTSVIKQIKNLNLKVAMDDFGTKYSSLSVLRKLPMDTLKIDKSFCDELEIDKKTRDIIANTISLARALEMQTVAEGIESPNQVAFLKQIGCDSIQGNYYSKAVPKEEFEKFLFENPFEREGGRK